LLQLPPDAGHSISGISATHDKPRPFVDHAVIEFAGFIVARIVAMNDVVMS